MPLGVGVYQMKKITLLTMMVFASKSWSMGTLSFGQELTGTAPVSGPTLSLFVSEKLTSSGSVFYQSWTGIKVGRWASSDHSVNWQLNPKLSLGLGPMVERENGQNKLMLKVNTQYRLW
jgi:hypothetical protein